jgi:hypothetical protein
MVRSRHTPTAPAPIDARTPTSTAATPPTPNIDRWLKGLLDMSE